MENEEFVEEKINELVQVFDKITGEVLASQFDHPKTADSIIVSFVTMLMEFRFRTLPDDSYEREVNKYFNELKGFIDEHRKRSRFVLGSDTDTGDYTSQ